MIYAPKFAFLHRVPKKDKSNTTIFHTKNGGKETQIYKR